ncbi:metallophosphoesterase [uncultured Psychroserpens sp.]|uniref:metallophosphoesterase family protein n=1 Tax=uncultured Psychroserpens sp. TaxID=255436 RepID=UPI00260C0BDE|nr:metallophosphoesterase [uncultured Psychroserpens sp.]
MKKIGILLLIFSLISCKASKNESYSFFIAGHAYGNPLDKADKKGLYDLFKDKIPYVNEQKNMKFGVLLGDVVRQGSFWPEAQKDISNFEMPIYIARGNHDGPLEQFEQKFGKSYRSFVQNKSLFIILDPNIDEWNISGEQLTFLKNAIKTNEKTVQKIFIFTHQMIWWHKRKYPEPFPNSLFNKSPEINYWSEIEPLLKELNKPVYLFAGDVGSFSKEHRKKDHIIEYDYYKDKNLTYVSTGMGGGVRDNFVIVDVTKEGNVSFRLIHLNGNDINGLGKLQDYVKRK